PLDVDWVRHDSSPIDPPTAIALFEDRAALAKPGFVIDDSNRRSVAAVCSAVDGLPLAIEIAASRVRSFSPAQLEQRLADPLKLTAVRAASPRHLSLEAAIDWSYALLSGDERLVLQRLSVLAGSFSLSTARACASAEPLMPERVTELLPGLIDKSLVHTVPDEDGYRYRLLESIRQFASNRLEDRHEVLDALATHLVDLGGRIDRASMSGAITTTFQELEKETDLLRQAVIWAIDSGSADTALNLVGSIGHVWEHSDLRAEGAVLADRAITQFDESSPRSRFNALLVASALNMPQDPPKTLRLAEEAMGLAQGLDTVAQFRAKLALSTGLIFAKTELDRVDRLTAETIAYFTETGDAWRLGHAHLAAAITNGLAEASLADVASAAAAFAAAGDRMMHANTKYWEATILLASEADLAKADTVAREAAFEARAIGSENEVAHAESVLAMIAFREHRYGDVETMTARLIPAFRRVADHRCQARMETFSALAGIAAIQPLRESRTSLERSLELALLAGGGTIAGGTSIAEAMDALGSLTIGVEAVQLHSAAAAARGKAGVEKNLSGLDYTQQIAKLRSELGDEAFDAAWAEGQVGTSEWPTTS
ncbi:MAG: ATP-binding protein, partial [Acidimicrobiia bacterium]